jgi:hypothetical protein
VLHNISCRSIQIITTLNLSIHLRLFMSAGTARCRFFRRAAGAIPLDWDMTTKPPKANKDQAMIKQARLQWLFDQGMLCDEHLAWGVCDAGDLENLKWLVKIKGCALFERYELSLLNFKLLTYKLLLDVFSSYAVQHVVSVLSYAVVYSACRSIGVIATRD